MDKTIEDFFINKSPLTRGLFDHFVACYTEIGMISLHAAKTMIGISNGHKRIAWVTQLGKNFVHIVFPFDKPYPDNLCFTKIARVPGTTAQFNHHFRMLSKDDINEEVMAFMKRAFNEE